jgi:hypothetical protein
LFALFACSEPTNPLQDAGTLPPDAGEARDADVPPDSGWRPKGKDTCGDGVLEPGEACFGRTVIPEPWVNAYRLEVDDRNRDGRDDVISHAFDDETGEPSGLAVFVNRGDGSFELAWTGPGGPLFDVDNDGCLDAANVFTASVTWWRCAEDGTFLQGGSYPIEPSTEYTGSAAFLEDLGGDGTADLIQVAYSSTYAQTLIVHAFNGQEFELELARPLSGGGWFLQPIDWDEDGLDLLVGEYRERYKLSYFVIPWSNGRPIEPIELPVLTSNNFPATIDLDGVPPIDFALTTDRVTQLFVNHGGVLEELAPISSLNAEGYLGFAQADGDAPEEAIDIQRPVGPAVIRDLPSGEVLLELPQPFEVLYAHDRWDANRDGIDDFIIWGEANHVYLRDANGSLAEPFILQTEDDFGSASWPLEADGDTELDLVGVQSGVTLGRRQNVVKAVPEFFNGARELWVDVGIADLGADGIADVAVLSREGVLATLRGNGQSLDAPEMQLEGIERFDSALFDADFLPDFAIVWAGTSIAIARTDPSGAIMQPLGSIAIGTRIDEIHAADLNDDSFADVVYRTPGLVGTLISDGIGGLQRGSTWPAQVSAVACADLDADGASEILLSSGTELLVLDARAELVLRTRTAAPQSSHLLTGDFDGDSDIDVVTLDSRDLVQLDGDGRGGFGEPRHMAGGWFAEILLAAELDGDAVTDLVVGENAPFYDSQSIRVMLGGSGGLRTSRRFMASTLLAYDPPPPSRLAVADINLDGAPDLIITRRGQVLVFYAYP